VTRVILAVDDDPTQLALIETACGTLEFADISILTAETLTEGIRALDEHTIDLVVTDHFLPDGTGLDLVDHLQTLNPDVPIIVMTAYESASAAVEFLKRGAADYLTKPLKGVDIQHSILRTLQAYAEREDEAAVFDRLPQLRTGSVILESRSEKMRGVMSVIARAAAGTASVLIEGESGTGKEVVARALHEASPRHEGPFVVVNCAALPEGLIESELFGSRKGAYTGSVADRRGRFEEADGGTLFIDEVGEIPLSTQVKLLRALQFRTIEPVGSNESVSFDARIVAATNRRLSELVTAGIFRQDLFYRLRVIGVTLPPLRERKDDIPVFLDIFLERFAAENGKNLRGFTREAFERLMRHDYPGNIRELENTVESAVVLSRSSFISTSDLPDHIRPSGTDTQNEGKPSNTLDERLQNVEREIIQEALHAADGNQSEAARLLGIGERRLRSRLERLGLKRG
jgi:DNA-binding NtrC family response regulator